MFLADVTHPEAIFGDNLGRLKELKRKYDPKNTFRRWNIVKNLDRSR
jgi:FAD/FMN-containing dehydrogenase